MKELGRVVAKKNNKALIRINRKSSCSKCRRECFLAGDSHEIEKMEIEVDDNLGVRKGQIVRLEMGEKPLLIASFIIYLIPLLGLIGGYFIGAKIGAELINNSRELSGILGSVLFFFLTFIILKYIDRRIGNNSSYHPRITAIVEQEGNL